MLYIHLRITLYLRNIASIGERHFYCCIIKVQSAHRVKQGRKTA